MVTTKKGRELAAQMMRHFDSDKVSTFDLAVPLSRLCRLAPAYQRIQEAWWNGDVSDREREQAERRERIIEARAALIVALMPAATTGPLELVLTGDPRGYSMRVKVPGAEHDGNTWGLGGEYGVG